MKLPAHNGEHGLDMAWPDNGLVAVACCGLVRNNKAMILQ
jgi:hypothetical protein